jgi:hypothetical protein
MNFSTNNVLKTEGKQLIYPPTLYVNGSPEKNWLRTKRHSSLPGRELGNCPIAQDGFATRRDFILRVFVVVTLRVQQIRVTSRLYTHLIQMAARNFTCTSSGSSTGPAVQISLFSTKSRISCMQTPFKCWRCIVFRIPYNSASFLCAPLLSPLPSVHLLLEFLN